MATTPPTKNEINIVMPSEPMIKSSISFRMSCLITEGLVGFTKTSFNIKKYLPMGVRVLEITSNENVFVKYLLNHCLSYMFMITNLINQTLYLFCNTYCQNVSFLYFDKKLLRLL